MQYHYHSPHIAVIGKAATDVNQIIATLHVGRAMPCAKAVYLNIIKLFEPSYHYPDSMLTCDATWWPKAFVMFHKYMRQDAIIMYLFPVASAHWSLWLLQIFGCRDPIVLRAVSHSKLCFQILTCLAPNFLRGKCTVACSCYSSRWLSALTHTFANMDVNWWSLCPVQLCKA